MMLAFYISGIVAQNSSNRFAFSLQMPYNINKMGVGMRFSYNFTDILRFSLDGDYFFYTKPSRTFNTITEAGVKGKMGWGKMVDANPNLNFVFGKDDFHFYVITGVYFSYGYREFTNGLVGLAGGGNYVVIDNVYYYKKEQLVPSLGIGFNGGCGIEFQTSNSFRLFFEQQLSLGLMTSWMAKMGASFCF